MTTLTTYIHAYSYDVSQPADREAYARLCADLADIKPRQMHAIGSYYLPNIDGLRQVELETKHLFNNQWNTAPGCLSENGARVFDWAEKAIFVNGYENRKIKRGHWLEQTAEMTEIRKATSVCGYCGKQEPTGAHTFCPHCLDSQYLTEKDLFLTRMLPVCDTWSKDRAPLTAEEAAERVPLFVQAQTHGSSERGRARMQAQRERILHKAELQIDGAKVERDGFIWLLDHGINIDNVIFYSHTGRFGFGWRKKLSAAELSALQSAMGAEFGFPYDIECDDGRKLSAN